MNNESLQLIEQLANKLGTTTEYIWSVLLAQAEVTAIINITFYALYIITTIVLIKLHLRFNKTFKKKVNEYSSYNTTLYEEYDHIMVIMGVMVFVWLMSSMVVILSIGNTITAIFHPEYWALKQILNIL